MMYVYHLALAFLAGLVSLTAKPPLLFRICISNNTIGYTKKSVVNGVQIIAYGLGNWFVLPSSFLLLSRCR